MNDLVEKLLPPVSADQPCGPDLSSDPQFDELVNLLKGKPEVDIGAVQKPAEPPDWRELKDKSAAYLGRSKHLQVAVMLCCSSLKTGGLEGFRDGLQLIRGLVEQYWTTLYPLLDVEDNNDPTQRLSLLSALTAAPGSVFSGWLKIGDYLYLAPACQPKGLPPVTFEQLAAARQKAAGEGAAADAPDPAQLAAAIRNAGTEQVLACQQALQQAREAVQGIDHFLTTTLGSGGTISFEGLEKSLADMLGLIAPHLPGGAVEPGTGAAGADAPAGADAGAAAAVRGPIRSRDDVARALEEICVYYEQVEPGSPVPFLLRRAQKLAAMNFVQAMQELNLATLDALRPSMGSALEGAAPAEGTPPA